MKYLLFIFLLTSCSSVRMETNPEYDYYYYSPKAYESIESMISHGVKSVNHATVDGLEFTCCCDPKFINETYKKNFPDVVLVKKLKKGTGKVVIRF